MNIDLDLHQYRQFLKLKKTKEDNLIFDPIRKKYIIIQPEEIVRQLFLAFILHENIYPVNLIQVEKGIRVNDLMKRFDVVIYDRKIRPFILIEIKSHKSKLNQTSFDQAARYNIALKAPYLILTNGMSTRCAFVDHQKEKYEFLSNLPSLSEA